MNNVRKDCSGENKNVNVVNNNNNKRLMIIMLNNIKRNWVKVNLNNLPKILNNKETN